MNILKRLFGNTFPYKFLYWLYGKYQEDQARVLLPEQFKEFGKGVYVDNSVLVSNPEKVILKDNVILARGVIIDSIGGLYIGENTGVAQKSVIITSNHHYRNAETIPWDKVLELKPVIIRENVWFGIGVMIMPGIEIGEGAILGLGSVITKSVPPLAIVVGNPAEIIGYRSKDHYFKCKSENKTRYPMDPDFQYRIIDMYKIKYEKELKELGLL